MKRTLPFLIWALVVAAIAVVIAIENQPQRLPLLENAQEPSEKAEATARRLRAVSSSDAAQTEPAWRLLTLCPTGRRNIPTLNERSA